MKDLVEYIVKQLVNNPDAVKVSEETGEEGIILLLDVAPEDMGIIIGKGGQTIKSIRRLLTVKAIADNVRVNLRLNEIENSNPDQTELEIPKSEETEEVEKVPESEEENSSKE